MISTQNEHRKKVTSLGLSIATSNKALQNMLLLMWYQSQICITLQLITGWA